MDLEQFISVANSKHASKGLPRLDSRDLPELAKLTGDSQSRWLDREYTERDAENPRIKEFLQKKQQRIRDLQTERTCLSCKEKFTPTSNLDLYLYCELRFPPPEDYCPSCLNRIVELMESRQSAENFRCC